MKIPTEAKNSSGFNSRLVARRAVLFCSDNIAADAVLQTDYEAAILCQVVICASSQQQPQVTIQAANQPDTLVLSFKSGRLAITALQWEIAIPQALSVNLADIDAGAAARKSGKSLTCAPKKTAAHEVRYACILAGGRDGFGDGALAVVHYRRNADVHEAPIRVAVENVVGATMDAKRVAIPGSQAVTRVQ